MDVKNKTAITIRGSAKIVCDYLSYGINSILFQRGIYPPEDFQPTEMYGLSMLMSVDNKIKAYLTKVLEQLNEWLMQRAVNKVSLIIANVKTETPIERWDFNIEHVKDNSAESGKEQVSEKPLKIIQNEIRDVLKQITSSVTFLPLIDCLCGFDIQIYTKANVELPLEWSETTAANITNGQKVKLRSFSTDIHKVETLVTYRNDL